MGRRVTGPQDINVRRLVRKLENTKILLWKEIADSLKHARRSRTEANLGHINRVVNDGDTIVVPGKVLGAGLLEHKITIGALTWSGSVKEKVEASGSQILSLSALMEANPAGSNIRIVK
jgi:large subunit ribosomal protein L18e